MSHPRARARLHRPPLLLALATLSACASPDAAGERPWLALGEPERVGGVGSGEPSLHATAAGEALLTWLEPSAGGGHALRLAFRGEGGWTEPRTVRESDRFFVNWADFPSAVRTEGGRIVVHWLEKVAEAPYAYHVMLSTSADDGATWSDPVAAHRDDSPTEHGFVSMVPWEDGVAVLWLDGRAMAGPGSDGASVEPGDAGGAGGDPHGAAASEPTGDMSLRFTILSPEGVPGPDLQLDGRTCECCQTSLARTDDGLVAAYRDRSPDEVRDIARVRWTRGAWSAPERVAADDWHIAGCPVNGPQLSADGRRVVVAWFTGAGGEPRVRAAFSSDGGASFGDAVRIDEGAPVGRVDVELLGDGSAVVVWLEASGEEPRVLARRVRADGAASPPAVVARTESGRASGFPRLARLGEELLFAWTAPGDPGGVRVRAGRARD